jgi:hypothetical protein
LVASESTATATTEEYKLPTLCESYHISYWRVFGPSFFI